MHAALYIAYFNPQLLDNYQLRLTFSHAMGPIFQISSPRKGLFCLFFEGRVGVGLSHIFLGSWLPVVFFYHFWPRCEGLLLLVFNHGQLIRNRLPLLLS